MRILITNDDGIHAPGLDICAEIGRALSTDIWIVAPEIDQSGVAHSLSLNDPLRLRQIEPRRFAVKGTPTDCVILAVRHILERPPDLILSGVNRGQNVAEDVTYSGTVAGAIEGAILGIASVALSQSYSAETRQSPHWQTGIDFAPDLIRKILQVGMPKDVLVNINFPNVPSDQVAGVAVTAQGKRDQNLLRIEARHDGRNNPYYWIAYAQRTLSQPAEGTDLSALAANRISVTPLRLDLTDQPFMTKLGSVFS